MRSSFLFLSLASVVCGVAFAACGGISDPTRGNGSSEPLGTVSGALTGTAVPDGTHVALVWRLAKGNGFTVLGDAPVVDGKFRLALATPPDSLFKPASDTSYDALNGSSEGSNSTAPSTGSGGSTNTKTRSFDIETQLAPRDAVSGQVITQPLEYAVAGFVVYVDKNGNGKLDLTGSTASSPDRILGGNRELLLTFFRNGGPLAYEKLRDRSGILPHAGYNLAWNEGRWLPLDIVELTLAEAVRLPSTVCYGDGPSAVSKAPSATGTTYPAPTGAPVYVDAGPSSGGGVPTGPFPNPGAVGLTCLENGMSYVYSPPCTTTPSTPPSGGTTPPPAAQGLCSSSGVAVSVGPISGGTSSSCVATQWQTIPPGASVPDGWPCPVVVAIDAGAGPVGSVDSGI